MPNYQHALELPSVEADSLTPRAFYQKYVNRMRPCLVRNAVRHWPAVERWQSVEYLREKIGNPMVEVATDVLPENTAVPPPDGLIKTKPFAEFFAAITAGELGHQVLHAYPIFDKGKVPPRLVEAAQRDKTILIDILIALSSLSDDVGSFPFLIEAPLPRAYARKRIFFYKDSYTDWHFHFTDETLMCQIKGTKHALLLPPDRRSWEIMMRIDEPYRCEALARGSDLVPYKVAVSAGDALYIPTCWWHAVEAIGPEWGSTLAWCWGTPLHLFDPRLPAVRQTIRAGFGRDRPFLRKRLTAASWSVVHGLITGRYARAPYAA